MTVRTCPNLNNIDKGIVGEVEESMYVSPDEAWETITAVIDKMGAILGKMNFVLKQFEKYNSQVPPI